MIVDWKLPELQFPIQLITARLRKLWGEIMEGLSNLTGNKDLRRRKLEGGGGDLPAREGGANVDPGLNQAAQELGDEALEVIARYDIYDAPLSKEQLEGFIAWESGITDETRDLLSQDPDLAKTFARLDPQGRDLLSQVSPNELPSYGELIGQDLENRLFHSKQGGTPLPDHVQAFMGPRLGVDLSPIRVHTDSSAVQMNRDLGAQAFAHGNHVYYGAGKGPANDHLTAHELTHTVQQGAVVRATPQSSPIQKQSSAQDLFLQAQEDPSLVDSIWEGIKDGAQKLEDYRQAILLSRQYIPEAIGRHIEETLQEVLVGLESIVDILVGLVDLVKLAWDILSSLLSGNIFSDAEKLWNDLSNLDVGALVQAGIEHLTAKWNHPDLMTRWHFRGWLVGYAVAEIVMMFFSGGIITAIKGAAKAGKFSKVVSKFPQVARLVKAAEQMADASEVKKLREALRASRAGQALAQARQWAGRVLKIPADILEDLSLDAINRLKRLSAWSKQRLSELNPRAMRNILGCASPCKVVLKDIEDHLKGLAARGSAQGKLLTTVDDVLSALPEQLVSSLGPFRSKFNREMMDIIKNVKLTDADFEKLRDFLPASGQMSAKHAYNGFTQYLSAVVPAKIGPDIDTFNQLSRIMNGPKGRALKGPMFENFAKLHLPEFSTRTFERVNVQGPTQRRNLDLFVPEKGEIWEFKNQITKPVPPDQASDFASFIGRTTESGVEVKSVNYLFATREMAELNATLASRANFNVFYVDPRTNRMVRF